MDTSQFGRVQGTYEVGPWCKPVPASGIQHWLPAAQALSLGRVEMWGQKIDRALLLGRVPQFLIFTILGESPFPTQRSKLSLVGEKGERKVQRLTTVVIQFLNLPSHYTCKFWTTDPLL